jgi:hypothetical protein
VADSEVYQKIFNVVTQILKHNRVTGIISTILLDEGKKPLGRQRRRWKYNIKVDLQEVECGV